MATKRKNMPLNDYFESTWKQNREQVAQLIIDNSIKELYREAGKIYARTRAGRR
jgi:hypothetical protein